RTAGLSPFESADAFHLIRITMERNVMKVYLDENPTPMAVGNSTDDDGSSRFEWGKSGGPLCGASIDWMTILNNGAYAPGTGPALPADLFLSSDARLTELKVNDVPLDNFNRDTLRYQYDVGSATEVPTIDFTTASDLATVDISYPASIPNSIATIEVTAQDGFTKRVYEIEFITTVSTQQLHPAARVSLFPNPGRETLFIKTEKFELQRLRIFDVHGRLLRAYDTPVTQLEIATLPTGLYGLELEDKSGALLRKKFLVQD
ncbi:MAG: T9SS type A sorting domain-containing protein, partial [Bacteroidota bacterium]